MIERRSLQDAEDVRRACRAHGFDAPTAGLAPGYAQANLVVLPRELAPEFHVFCQRNPKPCPLLDVTGPGETAPRWAAPHADLRTDLPRYRVWRQGELIEEPTDIRHVWRDDFVSFLLGCSFTFDALLVRAGIPVRHIDMGCNVPMFLTNIPCTPAGKFQGPMVVSMRPMRPADAIRAVQITSRYPAAHGAPVHLGSPEQIGIAALGRPDFGDPVPVREDELAVFWACGVTPQAAIMAARLPFAITHAPGCMFVTDLKQDEFVTGECG